jgi:hypothetical protein
MNSAGKTEIMSIKRGTFTVYKITFALFAQSRFAVMGITAAESIFVNIVKECIAQIAVQCLPVRNVTRLHVWFALLLDSALPVMNFSA